MSSIYTVIYTVIYAVMFTFFPCNVLALEISRSQPITSRSSSVETSNTTTLPQQIPDHMTHTHRHSADESRFMAGRQFLTSPPTLAGHGLVCQTLLPPPPPPAPLAPGLQSGFLHRLPLSGPPSILPPALAVAMGLPGSVDPHTIPPPLAPIPGPTAFINVGQSSPAVVATVGITPAASVPLLYPPAVSPLMTNTR